MSNIKPIYEWTVDQEKEIEREETRQEGDSTITVKTKVKDKVPLFFAFKRPSRAEREEADAYRVSQWGEFVKKGILPQAILEKTYANAGGVLNDEAKKEYWKMLTSFQEREMDYQRAVIAKETDKSTAIAAELAELRDKIMKFERERDSLYENTAEVKARGKLIEYLAIYLCYTRETIEQEWVPYFKGIDLTDKCSYFDALEEKDDEIFLKMKDRLFMVASLFVMSGGAIKREGIDAFLKDIEKPAETANAQSPQGLQ